MLIYIILLFLYKEKEIKAQTLLHEYNEQFVLDNSMSHDDQYPFLLQKIFLIYIGYDQ